MEFVKTDKSNGNPAIVSVDAVKDHLRVTHDEQDDYIKLLVLAAEDLIGDLVGVQPRLTSITGWFGLQDVIAIPFPPVGDIAKVSYLAVDGTYKECAEDSYAVVTRGKKKTLVFKFFPDDLAAVFPFEEDVFQVEYEAGFKEGESSSPQLKLAISLLVAHWFFNHLPVSELKMENVPWSLKSILLSVKTSNVIGVVDEEEPVS